MEAETIETSTLLRSGFKKSDISKQLNVSRVTVVTKQLNVSRVTE